MSIMQVRWKTIISRLVIVYIKILSSNGTYNTMENERKANMTTTYVKFWNAINTWKIFNVTVVDRETSSMPWTSYQSTT